MWTADSSSGAIGTAVNHAIEELVSIIAKAPVDLGRRARCLERLWGAYVADAIPYLQTVSAGEKIPCMLPQVSGCSQNRRRRGRSKNP
jgi:hypothetical protein